MSTQNPESSQNPESTQNTDATEAVAPTVEPAPDGGWIRRLLPFVKAHQKKVLIALGASVFGMIATAMTPVIEKVVIDSVITRHWQPLWPWLTLLVLAGLFGFATSYIRRYVGGRVALDVQYDLRNAIFERLQRLDFARHDELPTGQLVSRASSDLALIQALLSFTPILVGNLVLVVVSLVVMLILSPLLTLVAVLCLPALLFVAIRLRFTLFPATWDSQQRTAEVAGVVDEAVSGVRVVKGFGQEQRELDHLTGSAEELFKSRVRVVELQARLQPALQVIPTLGQVAVLALGGWLAINGHITLGTFFAFSSYLVQLVGPVRMFAGVLAVAQQARAGAERVLEILDSNPIVNEKPDAVEMTDVTGAIDFDHVTYGYLRSEPVLVDFELHIEPGETVALVGASGSGKSTVSLLLPRFYDVQEGALRIDGVDVRDVTLESLRHDIGVVFEDSFLFSDSVRSNIAYGRPDATDAEVERAARAAGAHTFITHLPQGYDTTVGERGLTLSGGQRQRVAIARALITDPSILILDDATSSVDARTEEQIHHTLREIMQGRTTILIAHRRSTLQLAERIVLVDEGRVLDQGTHDELIERSHLYRELLAGPEADLDVEAETDLDVEVEAGALEPVGARSPVAQVPTPELWRHEDAGDGPRAFLQTATVNVRAGGGGGGGGGGRGMGGGGPMGGVALAATPALLAAVDKLPPADAEPRIDVAAESVEDSKFTLRRFLRPYHRPLGLGLLLVAVDTLLTLAGPFLVRAGLDQGVAKQSTTALWIASGAFLAVTLLDWIDTWAYMRFTGTTAERLLFALRIRIFSHLQRLSVDFYDREMAGRVMTRMTTDVEALSALLQNGMIQALVSVLSFFGVLVALTFLSWPLMLAVSVVIPPLLVATVWFRRRSDRAYGRARESIATVNANFQENLSGVRVTQAYTREDRNIGSFRKDAREYLGHRLDAQRLVAIYFPLVLLLAALSDAIVLGAGSQLVANKTVAVGTIIAFLLYLDQFFSPIQQLSQVFDTWQQARASMAKINELMAIRSGTPAPADPVALPAPTGAIRFEGVHFRYPTATDEALRGVDLDISPGQTVALVGETGAGKSTIVKLVARFYDVTGGRVLIDGVPVDQLDLGVYRRRLGYVPQEPFLFSGTIRDNIAYGRPEATDAEVELASRAVGAHEFVARLPGGYLHPVTERGRSLSSGQRQLICLARALIVDPAILLLDEATANLDLATEARVQRAMNTISAGRTTLVIAHRLQTARAADRIVVIDDGRIVEQGSHDELLERDGRYAQLWNATPLAPAGAG
ncbi:MAG: transporter ATP-binding protein [Actinomycetia bacterium]|nr:transporter ATP-binding protein [Actinomycetes bacterium]